MFITFWSTLRFGNIERILSEIYELIVAITLLKYFYKTNDLKGLKIVLIAGFISIGITCITSLIGLNTFPMAARDLAGMLAEDNRLDLINLYSRIGIAQYTFYTTLIFFVPTFIGLVKNSEFYKKTNFLIIAFIVLIIITNVKSQYFSNILNSLLVGLIAINGIKNIKSSIVLAGFIMISFFLIPLDFYTSLLRGIQPYFTGNVIDMKIDDLIYTINGGLGEGNTGIEERASRIPVLWESFLNSPIFGGGIDNAHLHWLNKLSVFGLFGVIPYFILLFSEIKFNLKRMNSKYYFFYILAIVSFLFQGYMKSLLGNGVMITIYFLIPAVFYYNSIIQNNKNIQIQKP